MTDTEIRIGEKPTMPADAIARLTEQMTGATCFLEYGAGGSTVLAAQQEIEHIYSVESDPAYVAAVVAKVATLGSASTLHAIRADIGATVVFGHPANRSAEKRWPTYSAAVWDRLASDARTPELILVDGRFRVACCLMSFLRMAEDAVLMFDDYFGREKSYDVVTHFSPIHEQVGRLAVFRKPVGADREAMRTIYQRYATVPA